MRILFLTRCLQVGGAERQLVVLARGLRRSGHQVSVATFYGGGEFEAELRQDGVPIHDLAKRGPWDNAGLLWRLARLVRRERPAVIHSYLDSPNLAAAAVKPVCAPVKVVWGIRSTQRDVSAYGWRTRLAARVERAASPLADGIIANSEAARAYARAVGLTERHLAVVPNGIDCELFRPDSEAGERLRAAWAIQPDELLVGVVARLDPAKNHPAFLRAGAAAAAARPGVRFVCVGGGPPGYRMELEGLAAKLGLAPHLLWTGERRATRAEYAALDVFVLPSDVGEGFPNVVAEAMACGRPVVATDSGDVRAIVGDTGVVVPARDVGALAAGIVGMIDRVRSTGRAPCLPARRRIERHYSVDALVTATARLLERAAAGA